MSQGVQTHIADIDFSAFYAPVFNGSVEASTEFYETVATPGLYSDAKVILHQTARMVWLADRIDEVAKGRPAFQILFYVTAADLVAKIFWNMKGKVFKKACSKIFLRDLRLPPKETSSESISNSRRRLFDSSSRSRLSLPDQM